MSHQSKFQEANAIEELKPRSNPYWEIIEFGRHIGIARNRCKPSVWIARTRLKTGNYKRITIGPVVYLEGQGLTYEQAFQKASDWFETDAIKALASIAYPAGTNQKLKYQKSKSYFTVGDALIDFIEWKRVAAAPNYFNTTLSLVNHHLIPKLGDAPVEGFSARDFTNFCIDVLESPPKYGRQKTGQRIPLANLDHERLRKRKKTLNTLIGILRGAFRMAWENHEIENDRAWRLLKRIPHADVPRHIFLTRKEVKKLVAACREDLSNLVLGALYTGCRVSELAKLKVRDVGGHFFGIYVAPMKSYRSRYVSLPEEGMSFFLDQCEGKSDDDFVFTMRGNRPWIGTHKLLFKQAVRAAKLPENIVFHGLRHTYASQLVQAGTPIAIVARQLGHSNTDTVSRTYGHLSCQSIDEELALRFAPLRQSRIDPRLDEIRKGLSDFEEIRSSIPHRNYSQAPAEIIELLSTNEHLRR